MRSVRRVCLTEGVRRTQATERSVNGARHAALSLHGQAGSFKMSNKSEITWYVVADGGNARILTRDGDSMATVASFDSHGHGDTGENDVAAISQIKAPKSNPGEQVKALFARQVAEHLNNAANANKVDHIILAAPGHVLHDIREALNKPATHALGQTLSKDLTHVANKELASHFS